MSDGTHARLAALSASTGYRRQNIIEDSISANETTEFWRGFNDGYDVLAADSARWRVVRTVTAERMSTIEPALRLLLAL